MDSCITSARSCVIVVTRYDYLKFIAFTNENFDSSYCDLLGAYSHCFRSVIITLDGPKHIHNKRRVNPKHDSYDLIVKNLLSISDYGITVNVQINVNKMNAEHIDMLFEDLSNYEQFYAYQFTLNPVKYIDNTIDEESLFTLFFSLKKKYPFRIKVNNRLIENLTRLFEMVPIQKERCSLSKTYVLNLPEGNVYACPQNASSEIGKLSCRNILIDDSSLRNKFLQTSYQLGECKECEYSLFCPYCCPYTETPVDCKEKVNKRIETVLSMMFGDSFPKAFSQLDHLKNIN